MLVLNIKVGADLLILGFGILVYCCVIGLVDCCLVGGVVWEVESSPLVWTASTSVVPRLQWRQ
jgi:hypothetical protein